MVLTPLEGTLSEAFRAKPRTSDGSRAYTEPDAFLRDGASLGEDVELAQPPATVADVFEALFGARSAFRARVAATDDPRLDPVELVPGASCCATASASQTLQVPFLGGRPLEEELRFCLVRREGATTLAVQLSSKLHMGRWLGDMITEALHIFSQDDAAGPVRLRSLGQASCHKDKAISGMRDGRKKFVEIALEECDLATKRAADRIAGAPAAECDLATKSAADRIAGAPAAECDLAMKRAADRIAGAPAAVPSLVSPAAELQAPAIAALARAAQDEPRPAPCQPQPAPGQPQQRLDATFACLRGCTTPGCMPWCFRLKA